MGILGQKMEVIEQNTGQNVTKKVSPSGLHGPGKQKKNPEKSILSLVIRVLYVKLLPSFFCDLQPFLTVFLVWFVHSGKFDR